MKNPGAATLVLAIFAACATAICCLPASAAAGWRKGEFDSSGKPVAEYHCTPGAPIAKASTEMSYAHLSSHGEGSDRGAGGVQVVADGFGGGFGGQRIFAEAIKESDNCGPRRTLLRVFCLDRG